VDQKKSLMKYLVLLVCSLLGLTNANAAQKNSDTLAHTLLWKITGNGLAEPSYLYGTMHTGDDKVFRLTDSTMNAFDRVKAFAMEINMDSVDQMSLAMQMKLPEGQTVKDLLGDDDYKLAGKYTMKQAGIPIFLLNTVKPIYIWLVIMQGKQSKKDDVLDVYYFKLAKKQNKQLIGLEKAEDQMKLLTNISINKQVTMLKEGIHDFKGMQASMKETTLNYADADLNKLLAETESDTSMGANFMEVFITKRNRVMANGMVKVMHSQTSLFTAVGAAHLPGKDGIIALLKKDGYTVTPVISQNFLKAKDVKKRVK
jgi:uncharacterized protein YbaP (TraB family)